MQSQGCSLAQTLFLSLLKLPEEDFPQVIWGEVGGGGGNLGIPAPFKSGALSIHQKKPVQDFGIFAGQMERVLELESHVRRLTVNPGHA